MVGAAGIVASTINNRHQRRESRGSQSGEQGGGGVGSKATISEAIGARYARGHDSRASGAGTGTAGLPPEPPEVIPEKLTFREQVKFYVSLTLGIVASICVFALLFLIPLVVEPSISTLLADFDPESATCVTIEWTYATGLSKCGAWSSCQEGCTSMPAQCHQIYVNYRKAHNSKYPRLENYTMLAPVEWEDESRWDVSYTMLLVNAKGCGYPPSVNCEEFGDIYGQVGRTFPCFYSRVNPRLVVTDYNWQETAYPLLISLGLPTSLFAVSISVLSFWYCPSCEERGKDKRPCRSRYKTAPTNFNEDLFLERERSRSRNLSLNVPAPPQQPILQQPPRNLGKLSGFRPNSPSLATISSRDTTVSSVSSLDDGWQSPPSPPPRANPRMASLPNSNVTRTRKLQWNGEIEVSHKD